MTTARTDATSTATIATGVGIASGASAGATGGPAGPGPAVRVRFLGDFRLTVRGEPVDRWRAGKARGLFQFLVLHRGQVLTRDRLHDALWPGAAGGSSLKVAAHALRRVLDAHPDRPGDSGIRLLHRDFGYVLHVDGLWSDLEAFRELVHTGLRAAARGDTAAARGPLRAALDLYGGEFLRGEDADWVVEQREYLRALALRALTVLRADAEAREDGGEVIELCRRALAVDRHHEETYRALMAAHGRRGELACVRRWYELCARRLREELAVDPAPETRALLRALVPAAAPRAPAGGGGPIRAARSAGRRGTGHGVEPWAAGLPARPARRARADTRARAAAPPVPAVD
ncbi:AfsR/SARP family transcriptional regulator [Streptomyces sp. BI20]|uniref:AfsR/SARP family transcriptional regulator n=1 Tax=Streptomyces sp. BI20 TaxID=3403460 RepID=UPI003C71AABD